MLYRGKQLFYKETSDMKLNQEKLLEAGNEEKARAESKITTHIQNLKEVSINSEPQDIQESALHEVSDELKAILRDEKKIFPMKKVMFIVLNWLFVILITFMKGDSGMKSIVGIQKCSGEWVGLLVVFALACIGSNIFIGYLCVKSTEVKQRLNYDWDEFDLRWTHRTATIVSSTALLAGVLAGMLGFGGGLIMGPLMLSLGVRPEQSAATSSFMILFTSSIAVIQYSTANRVNTQYGILLLLAAFIGSSSGIFVVKRLVDKYRRPSFVVFTLAIVLGLAGIIIPVYGISSIIQSYNNGTGNFGFKDLCTE